MRRVLLAACLGAGAALSAGCGGGGGPSGGGVLPPPPPPSGPLAWGAPTTLVSNIAIGSVAAAVASDGAVTVAWPQAQVVAPGTTPLPYVVARSQRAGASTWDALQVLEAYNASNAAADSIAELQGSGGGGATLFAWRRTTSAVDRLGVGRRDNSGAAFTTITEAPLGAGMNGIALAANDAGDQVAVWAQSPGAGAPAQVFASRRSGVGSWSAPVTLQTNAAVAGSEPAVAVDANGRAMVAWREGATNAQLWSRVIDASGALGTPQRVDANQLNDARNPRLAVLGSNLFMLTWEQGQAGATGYDLRATRWTGAGWLGAPATVDTSVSTVLESRLVSGALQGATAVWRQDGFVYAARFSAANGNWAAPVQLNAALAGTGQDVRIGSDAAGNAIVAWTQRPASGVTDLYYAALNVGSGTFSAPAALENNGGGVGVPALAVASGGTAVVAWLQAVNGQVNPDLVARVLRP